MGLLAALNASLSALNVNQQNLDVLAQNIANANTQGYSNEKVNQQADYIDGQGVGVSVEGITRTVSNFLNSEVQNQTSLSGGSSVVQSYYTDIENLLGQPGGTNSIDQGIDTFFSALQNMANSPGTESGETTAINAGTTVASQISSLASSLYNLQLQSDNDISSAISSVNTDLTNLKQINQSIEQATATGQSTAGLLDQRDSAITDISQYIGVTPTYGSDGEVTLNTTGGTTILTPTTYSQLSYQGASGTSTFVSNNSLSPITVTSYSNDGTQLGSPATLASGGPASSVTTSITSGQIQGLLTVRDQVIPNLVNQLDTLASNLRDQVNAVSNKGTSSPPPNSYTGVREANASTTSQYTGELQIAVLNSNGQPITSPYADETNGVPPLTLNLGSLNYGNGNGVLSLNNIVSAINENYGTQQNKFELGNINNAQLVMASDSVPNTAGGTFNFGLNLNNISGSSSTFTVNSATIYAGAYDPNNPGNNIVAGTVTNSAGSTNLDSTTTVASGTTVNTTSQANGTFTATLNSNTAGTNYYTVVASVTGDNGVTSQVSYQIPAGTSNVDNNVIGATSQTGSGTIVVPSSTAPLVTAELVDANGNPLTETNGSYGNQQGYLKISANNSSYTVSINELNSQQTASGQGFSQYFGLNNFFNTNNLTANGDTLANSALNLSVESAYTNTTDPKLLSTATLSLTNPDATDPPNYTYQISSGDNSNSQNFAALANTTLSFNAAGGMPATSTSLSQYAGQIIAFTSTNSTDATNTATNNQTLLTGFTSRAQAVSGVNTDQELANTVIYQNAYAASAKVISVVGTMFNTLLSSIGT